MKKRPKSKSILILLVVLVAAAVFAYAGFRVFGIRQSGERADRVLESMRTVIPNLGVDTGGSTGLGRDPLGAIPIDGLDIVGCLEVPSIDLMVPVTGKDQEEEGFATWLSGSPVKGSFSLIGGHEDVFRKIAKLRPGDNVIFTDVDGVRYEYQVTTQYHLKKWDEGDNEMKLCYRSDDKTYFVVGCGKSYSS